jgi:hypothetical protein
MTSSSIRNWQSCYDEGQLHDEVCRDCHGYVQSHGDGMVRELSRRATAQCSTFALPLGSAIEDAS